MAQKCIRFFLYFNLALNVFWIVFYIYIKGQIFEEPISSSKLQPRVIYNIYKNNTVPADCPRSNTLKLDSELRNKPYIFIGGVPSSGTTLARAMLDAHPEIRCGEETRLVPRILQMRERWRRSKQERKRLEAAGLNDTIINVIVRNFISNVIELHGPPARYLCDKDPLSLSQMPTLRELFPNAKFLLMIRDGRAVAHSIVSRNITITGVDHKSYLSAALFWNRAIEKMWSNCKSVGDKFCLPVYFEQLVTSPREHMEKILNFLDISWNDNVMHHSDFLNSEVSLSK